MFRLIQSIKKLFGRTGKTAANAKKKRGRNGNVYHSRTWKPNEKI